jgi:hypothetical protein
MFDLPALPEPCRNDSHCQRILLETKKQNECIPSWMVMPCIGRESNPGLAESIEVNASIGNGQFYH